MGIPAGKGSWRRPASTWRRSSPSTCSVGPCAGVGAATTLCSRGARGRSMAEEKKSGSKGAMTVSEAGRKGGVRVRETRGRKFYEEIGRKGGHKVRELIEKGKAGGEEEAGHGHHDGGGER